MGDGGAAPRRRVGLLRLCGLLLLPAAVGVHAVRVSDVPLYATLTCSASATLGARQLVAAAGSHVALVGEVAGLGVPPGAERRWFARVIAGPDAGAELTVSEGCLRDQRSQPEPPASAPAPR